MCPKINRPEIRYLKGLFVVFFIIICFSPIFLSAQSYFAQFTSIFSLVSGRLKASFSYSPIIAVAGMPVRFIDTSKGSPESWLWEFGDGSLSYEKSPSHYYENSGIYSVSLSVSKSGSSSKATRKIKVYAIKSSSSSNNSGNQELIASFTFSPSSPYVGQTVQFTDNSSGSPTSWSWKFGDGGTSTQKNPTHSYSSAGSYNVTLTVSNGTSSNSMTQTITVKPNLVANFNYSPVYPTVGQEIQFNDNSQGSPISWSWDFGDGGNSTSKNPMHTYSRAGTFNVKLTISDGSNSNTANKSISIYSSSTNVITAASCELADVQAAIDAANPGDTVVVPNGTATWNGQLAIDKGIILKAATKGGVTIIGGFEGTNYDDNNFLIKCFASNPGANEPFRISGFKLDCNHKVDGILVRNNSTTPINRVRIDNNEIFNLQSDVTGRSIIINGPIYGVADNNVFHHNDSETYRFFGFYDYYFGMYAWQYYTFDYGTGNNFYFEDNVIYTSNVVTGNGAGGRYAFRYNTVIVNRIQPIVVYMFDAHGNMGDGGNWGQMGIEIYENDIYLYGNGICLIDLRGGKGLVYNNRLKDSASTVAYKVREEFNDLLNPPAKNLISGQPQYVSEAYFFNHTNNNSKVYPEVYVTQTIDYGGEEGIVPREDMHFFTEKANFDGSCGIGVGPVSQRPAYCIKEGVAWWATDENKLYRWHNGKWELYYIPYPYPHPLRTVLGD